MSRKIDWLAVPLAWLAITTAIACGDGSDEGTGASKNNANNVAAASKGDPQAISEVRAALTNFAGAKSFKVQIAAQTQQPNGMIGTSNFTYDFVPPDKYQLYTGPTAGITRVIGSEAFAYDRPSDTWSVLTDYSGPAYEGYNRLFDAKRMTKAANTIGKTASVTKGSPETIEGKTCQTYVITDEETQNKTDACIEAGLPLRFIYRSGNLSTTAVFSAYNSNVDLTRPPVR